MANKSYYHRAFIILKAESKGYEFIPNKAPAGYCKFEIRRGVGKAYIYVQDIKPSSALNGIYEAYLISADYSIRPCKLASLHVDEQGRGEHIATFDADDIMGTGYSLENFHALVVAFRSGAEGRGMRIAYPLIGYSSRNINIDTHRITESLKVIHGEKIEIESEPEILTEPEPEVKREAIIEVEPEEVEPESKELPGIEAESGSIVEIESESEELLEREVEPEVEPEEVESEEPQPEVESEKVEPEETEPEEVEPKSEELPEIEAEPEPIIEVESEPELDTIPEINLEPLTTYPGQPTQPNYEDENPQVEVYRRADEELRRSEEELKRAYEDSYQGYLRDLANQNRIYPYNRATYWDNVKDYFTGLFKAHQRIEPFDHELGDVEWIRVQQAIPGASGYYAESLYRYPYYNSSYPDHYILGLIKDKGETKYVVYGIPSMYSMIPPISINGFSRWASIKEGYGMGYWLLYIDAISGRVVYPYEKE